MTEDTASPPVLWCALQELATLKGLLSRLASPQDAADVQALWDSLLVARRDAEAVAARGARIARDVSRDWQETVTDLIDRIVAQDGEIASLKAQVRGCRLVLHMLLLDRACMCETQAWLRHARVLSLLDCVGSCSGGGHAGHVGSHQPVTNNYAGQKQRVAAAAYALPDHLFFSPLADVHPDLVLQCAWRHQQRRPHGPRHGGAGCSGGAAEEAAGQGGAGGG
jgi:hypothetical protein